MAEILSEKPKRVDTSTQLTLRQITQTTNNQHINKPLLYTHIAVKGGHFYTANFETNHTNN